MKRIFIKKIHKEEVEQDLKCPKDTTPQTGSDMGPPWPITDITISTFPQEETCLHATREHADVGT